MISKPGEITWITQATGKLTLTGGAVPGLVNDLVDDGVAVLDASVAYSSKRGGDQSNVVSAMPGGSKISVRT